MKPLYVLGAGGFAREVVNCLVRDINDNTPSYQFMGYVEKERAKVGTPVGMHTIVCCQDDLRNIKDAYVVIAIGSPKIIESIRTELAQFEHLRYPNLIHPGIRLGNILIGHGNIICEGNIFTTDISIGSFNIINLGSTIGHDSTIGNNCVINPGCHISGCVTVGDSCMLGTGAIILEKKKIESHSIIGGGAVVVKNDISGQTVVGVPAKQL